MADAETSLSGSFRIRLPTPNIVDLTADSDDEMQNRASSSNNHSSSMVRTTNAQSSRMALSASSRRLPHGVHPGEPIEIPSDDEDITYMGARQRHLPPASNLSLPGTRDNSPRLIGSFRDAGRPHMPVRAAPGEYSPPRQSCQ